MSDRLCACIPVLKRPGRVMLALPEIVFSAEELENGSVGSELPDLGPWLIEAMPVQGAVDDQTVNVLFLDFPLTLFWLLRTFQRKAVWPPDTAFFYGTDTAAIPNEEELVLTAQAWVADGKPRAVEGYHTALEEFPPTPRGGAPNTGTQQALGAALHQLTHLASTVNQLQSDMGEMRAVQSPCRKPSSPQLQGSLPGSGRSLGRAVSQGVRSWRSRMRADGVWRDSARHGAWRRECQYHVESGTAAVHQANQEEEEEEEEASIFSSF